MRFDARAIGRAVAGRLKHSRRTGSGQARAEVSPGAMAG
jgi:hypothetical protein